MAVWPKPRSRPAHAPARTRRPAGRAEAGRRPPRRSAGELRRGPTAPSPRLPAPKRPVGGVGALLSVFLSATLVMVVAVIAVGAVNHWWVLLPVMLVDFGVTFLVVAFIMRLLADDGESRA